MQMNNNDWPSTGSYNVHNTDGRRHRNIGEVSCSAQFATKLNKYGIFKKLVKEKG